MTRHPDGVMSPPAMKRKASPWAPGLFLTVAALASSVGAGISWACVPQPNIWLQPRSFAAPGEQLTVEGVNFEQNIELRWNGVDGPLLGSAPSPSFSVPITLPDVPDGLYVLVALERAQGGGMGNVARAPVQLAREKGPTDDGSVAVPTADDSQPSRSTVAATVFGLAGSVSLVVVGAIAGASRARRRTVGADS